jgi:hypothetical protein
MTPPCVCTHEAEEHSAALGFCEANGCHCMVFQTQDEVDEDAALDLDGPTELDFEAD